jgi:hypothetical protein
MVEYEESSLTPERANELLAIRDANTFVKELTGLTGIHASEALNNSYARVRFQIADGFSVKRVYAEGGGEGEGEYVERVFCIEHGEQSWHIKTTGSYYSYDGISWSGEFTFCEAREVVVTQYFDLT